MVYIIVVTWWCHRWRKTEHGGPHVNWNLAHSWCLQRGMASRHANLCNTCDSVLDECVMQVAFCVACAKPFCPACIAASNSIPEGSEYAAEENMCFPCHSKPLPIPRLPAGVPRLPAGVPADENPSVPVGDFRGLRVEISSTNRFRAAFKLYQPSARQDLPSPTTPVWMPLQRVCGSPCIYEHTEWLKSEYKNLDIHIYIHFIIFHLFDSFIYLFHIW